MVDKDRVIEALFNVIDNLNRQVLPDAQLKKSTGTILSGEGAQLDSLGIINFVVAVEQEIEDEFHTIITLTDDTVLAAADEPLRTIDSLADHLVERLEGKRNV